MADKLQELPVGTQGFRKLRRTGQLYVDKTEKLLALTQNVQCCFLSRPRRFGKSLTLSTIAAMFDGPVELFEGLWFGEWLKSHTFEKAPVISLDMSSMDLESIESLRYSITLDLRSIASDYGLVLQAQGPGDALKELIKGLGRPAVLLIDEYDRPLLEFLGESERLESMKRFLRGFYSTVKSCEPNLRFLMLTGITKFSWLSVFSAMNNLKDISMNPQWGDLLGYTQSELEDNFAGWIDYAASTQRLNRCEYLTRLKEHYDGFCFDGVNKVYNPFSVMQALQDANFDDYWYDSATPAFIGDYLKLHSVQSLEQFRHVEIGKSSLGARDIDAASPESFLYQAGYLTIEKMDDQELTLDYPNREVLSALSRTFVETTLQISDALVPGLAMLRALQKGDIDRCMERLNSILAGVASELFRDKHESTYNIIFTSLLRGARAKCESEGNSSRGRCDLKVFLKERIYVVEFKLAKKDSDAKALLQQAKEQIVEKGYMEPHSDDGRQVIPLAVVFSAKNHKALLWSGA